MYPCTLQFQNQLCHKYVSIQTMYISLYVICVCVCVCARLYAQKHVYAYLLCLSIYRFIHLLANPPICLLQFSVTADQRESPPWIYYPLGILTLKPLYGCSKDLARNIRSSIFTFFCCKVEQFASMCSFLWLAFVSVCLYYPSAHSNLIQRNKEIIIINVANYCGQ